MCRSIALRDKFEQFSPSMDRMNIPEYILVE